MLELWYRKVCRLGPPELAGRHKQAGLIVWTAPVHPALQLGAPQLHVSCSSPLNLHDKHSFSPIGRACLREWTSAKSLVLATMNPMNGCPLPA